LKLTVQVTKQQTGKAAGTVLDQDPKAGEKSPSNGTVILIVEGVAGGGNTATVTGTNVEGMPLAEAIGQLARARLKSRITRTASTQEGDIVLEQNPRSPTVVPSNTEVVLTVPDSLVTVPEVTGLDQLRAVALLTQKGLKVGQVKKQVEGSGAVGSVIEQIPKK